MLKLIVSHTEVSHNHTRTETESFIYNYTDDARTAYSIAVNHTIEWRQRASIYSTVFGFVQLLDCDTDEVMSDYTF